MAETFIRVVLPRNADELITLAESNVYKHQQDGARRSEFTLLAKMKG